MFKHILVPIDGSKLSRKAMGVAIRAARLAKARLTVMHIIARLDPTIFVTDYVIDPALLQDSLKKSRQQGKLYLRRAEEAARRVGVRCTGQLVTSDQIYKGIISTARTRKCDMIVMASHGRRGVSALVLGSETNKVLTHCKRPVLVVR